MESRIVETIAVYWEAIVRTYGITERSNQLFCRVDFPQADLGRWGRVLAELESPDSRFGLCQLVATDAAMVQLLVVLDQEGSQGLVDTIQTMLRPAAGERLAMEAPVELLCFHGPHFQDRYGIAEAASRALHEQAVPLLSSAFSGTSVFLVVPSGSAVAARAALARYFVLGGTVE